MVRHPTIWLALIPVLLVGLPLLGVVSAGLPVERYLEFPPHTRYVVHAPFSWPAFAALSLLLAALVGPVLLRLLRPGFRVSSRLPACSFPWWGWFALLFAGAAWVLAWSRFTWASSWQLHTFTPLWLGYILVINALTYRRTGHCLLVDRRGSFLALFPLSAAFWWFFEYLNRFVQNWYYVGISELGPVEYVLFATPSFSTVLPAVLSTTEWLASFARLDQGLQKLWRVRVQSPAVTGWAVLVLAAVGLMGIGIWPDDLFPLLWIAPLLILASLRAVSGEETIFAGLQQGDWRSVWVPALAALQCGFFWELWNSGSLAHWEYEVPYVHRFQLFAMPLLGYAGYLPFGLECLVIANLLPGASLSMIVRSRTPEVTAHGQP